MEHLKKIFVLHTSGAMGGAEYSLLEFLYNLHDNPIEIHMPLSFRSILSAGKLERPFYFHEIKLDYIKRCDSIGLYARKLFSMASGNFKLYRLIRKYKIKAIYCNTFRTLCYCILVKLLSKTQIICHCRDNIPRWLSYFILCFSNKCIAVSNNIRKQLLLHSKVSVIHNGTNTSVFSERKTNGWLHKNLDIPLNTKIIGNAGQIVSWKNQIDFVMIANELVRVNKNVHFLIIGGTTDENYFYRIKESIASFNLDSFFTLTGQINNIKDYLLELDHLIHTATNEPFGRVLIEAAAVAKPVISYSSGGPSEIIINGETGFLVEDGNVTKMVELSSGLLNDHSLKYSMGKAAQAHAAKYFDAKDYANKVCNILLHG